MADASKGLWVTLVSGFLAIAVVESPRESLRLLVDARLIANEQTREGLKQYFEGETPREPRQVTSFIQSGERVNLTPATPTNASRTDIDLFVCGSARTSLEAQALVENVHRTLEGSGHYGRIALKVWDGALYEELPERELKGAATLIYDAGHGEAVEVEGLQELLAPVAGLPLREVPNAGPSTPWLLSLVVCPG